MSKELVKLNESEATLLNCYSNICEICKKCLNRTYIVCAECKNSQQFRICLKCFASGAELNNHSNDHSYTISNDFIDNPLETAYNDSVLTELIEYGCSRQSKINSLINKFSNTNCHHLFQTCMDDKLWKTCNLVEFPYIREVVPYLFHHKSIDPPRCQFDWMQNRLNINYRFARSDFDTPFDSSAENIISNVNVEFESKDADTDIYQKLCSSLVISYNNRLRERHRRQQIVRNHGLIMPHKTKSWLSKYQKIMGVKDSGNMKARMGRFVAFMQIMTGTQFDRILECLQYERDLKQFILKLYELRAMGLKTLHGGNILQEHKILRAMNTMSKPTPHWKCLNLPKNVTTNISETLAFAKDPNELPKKRRSRPLNIIGLTNYERLNTEEQELCSTIRIVPNAFLTYKLILITENNKMGYLRLADARKLIKIDVNKTRVLYDFLVERGFINSPSHD